MTLGAAPRSRSACSRVRGTTRAFRRPPSFPRMRHQTSRAVGRLRAARWRCSFASTTTCPSRTWTPRSAPSATPCVSAPPRSRCARAARARTRIGSSACTTPSRRGGPPRCARPPPRARRRSFRLWKSTPRRSRCCCPWRTREAKGRVETSPDESPTRRVATRRRRTTRTRARNARRRGCGWTPSGSTPRRVSDRDPPANPPRQVSCAVRSHRVCFARLATTTDGRRVMGRRHAHTLGSSRWLAWTRRRAARFVSKTLRLLKKTTKTKNDTAKTSSRRNGPAGSCRREGARAKNWMAFISKTSMTSMTLPVRCSVRCAARASRRRSTRATRWRRASRSGPSRGDGTRRVATRAPRRRTTTTTSPNAAGGEDEHGVVVVVVSNAGDRPWGENPWLAAAAEAGRGRADGGFRVGRGNADRAPHRPRATAFAGGGRRSGTRTGPSSGPRRGSSAPQTRARHAGRARASRAPRAASRRAAARALVPAALARDAPRGARDPPPLRLPAASAGAVAGALRALAAGAEDRAALDAFVRRAEAASRGTRVPRVALGRAAARRGACSARTTPQSGAPRGGGGAPRRGARRERACDPRALGGGVPRRAERRSERMPRLERLGRPCWRRARTRGAPRATRRDAPAARRRAHSVSGASTLRRAWRARRGRRATRERDLLRRLAAAAAPACAGARVDARAALADDRGPAVLRPRLGGWGASVNELSAPAEASVEAWRVRALGTGGGPAPGGDSRGGGPRARDARRRARRAATLARRPRAARRTTRAARRRRSAPRFPSRNRTPCSRAPSATRRRGRAPAHPAAPASGGGFRRGGGGARRRRARRRRLASLDAGVRRGGAGG